MKYFFFMYLCSCIIPKYLNKKTPSQILYKDTVVTMLGYDDIEFILKHKKLSLLKRKRIIRFMEEANEQGKSLSYKDIASLSFSTKNTVSKWINDTQFCGYSVPITKDLSIPSRKTHIVNLFIDDKVLNKDRDEDEYEDELDTLEINYLNDYATSPLC